MVASAMTGPASAGPDASLREAALARLRKKREFKVHLAAFLLVNGFLWLIWGVVYATTGFWFPWAVFPLAGWSIGLVFHAWDTFGNRPFTEQQIEREQRHLGERQVAS